MNTIGIVGPLACGKGVVTEYFIKKYGYISFSLSSIVHDEVKKRGYSSYTRTILQDVGDDLRKKEGDGVLAKRAIEQLTANSKQQTAKRIIIEGIRNPGEVEYLRTISGFFLISVDAPQKVRFQRVLQRGKPWDPKSWEEFQTVDGRDQGDVNNTNGQQVKQCMKLADIHLQNNTSIAQFHKIIETVLAPLRLTET